MTRSATSAKATTSARRTTGGCSLLLSGKGVPPAPLDPRSLGPRSLGRTRNWLSPRATAIWLESRSTLPDSSSLQPAPVMKVPSRRRERSLLDGIRSICPGAELVSLGDVCCAEHQRDAHHRTGRHMAQNLTGNRRPSPRVTSALIFAGALLLAPVLLSSAASAQVLGFTSASRGSFPSDSMLAPALSDEGDGSGVVPERLRRAVIAFDTREAPGTVIIETGTTSLDYVLGQGRAVPYA